jgi:aldehyde dehydrogenase (NAD+)
MVTRGAMRSTGQKCTATSRVFVEKGIYSQFAAALTERVKQLKVGDGMAAETYLGPVVSATQHEKVMYYLEIGQREGATLGAGGTHSAMTHPTKGYFVPPTVFLDADPQSRIMQDEIFGPVVGLSVVDNLEAALEAANSVRYGLSAAIFSRDIRQIMTFTENIQAGLVHVNDETAGAEPQVPFGGYKESGSHSREQGKAARDFYTQLKTIYMDFPQ